MRSYEEEFARYITLCYLIKKGGVVEREKIVCLVYLLQEYYNLNVFYSVDSYDFCTFRKHILDDLAYLDYLGAIYLDKSNKYVYKYDKEVEDYLNKRVGKFIEENSDTIDKMLDKFGKLTPEVLDLIIAIYSVIENYKSDKIEFTKDDIVELVNIIKPYLKKDDISESFDILQKYDIIKVE